MPRKISRRSCFLVNRNLIEILKKRKIIKTIWIQRGGRSCFTSYPSGNQVDSSPLVAIESHERRSERSHARCRTEIVLGDRIWLWMSTSTSRNANAISPDSKILQQVVFEFGIGNIYISFFRKKYLKEKLWKRISLPVFVGGNQVDDLPQV